LIVLQDIKRFMRKSEYGLAWVHPRHWAASDPEVREVIDALEYAIDAVRERVEQRQAGKEPYPGRVERETRR
jgi:hypothetical protein